MTACHQCRKKGQILPPSGNELGNGQVMHLKTKPGRAARTRRAQRNETVLPTRGKHRGFLCHAMRVIPERRVEGRLFANGSVNQIRILRGPKGEDISLYGLDAFGRRIERLREDRLRANDDKLIRAGDSGRSAKDVLKLLSVHCAVAA